MQLPSWDRLGPRAGRVEEPVAAVAEHVLLFVVDAVDLALASSVASLLALAPDLFGAVGSNLCDDLADFFPALLQLDAGKGVLT